MLEAEGEVGTLVREQVAGRKADIGSSGSMQRTDVFSMLIQANENEEAKLKLDDSELVRTCIIPSPAL